MRVPTRLRRPLGTIRRTLSRLADRRGDTAYVPPTIELGAAAAGSSLLAPFTVPFANAIGAFLLSIDQPSRAQQWFEHSLRHSPQDGRALKGLGNALLDGGPIGLVRRPIVGLVSGRIGDAVRAAMAFEAAHRTMPIDDESFDGLIRSLLRAGLYDDAATRFEGRHSTSEAALRARSRYLDERGRARGAYLTSEAKELVERWTAILNMRPDDIAVRHRLVRHLVLMGRFDDALRTAWPACTVECDSMSAADDIPDSAPNDALYVAHAALLARALPAESHATKRMLARRLSASTSRTRAILQTSTAIQACNYAAGASAALDAIQATRVAFGSDAEELALRKLEGDVMLSCGDPGLLIDTRPKLGCFNPDAEGAFRSLINGARILVVGPAAASQPTESELASADVIVTTKRPHQLADGQHQVVYLSDASARLHDGGLGALTAAHPDRVSFVLRPSMVAIGRDLVPLHRRLRVMPAEDASTFLGTRFGIQRILYDLVGYEASSITLSGVDFFLATDKYVAGYATEVETIYSPRDLQPVCSVAPHDHLADFVFTRTLVRAGIVATVAPVDELLQLEVPAYLDRLAVSLRSDSGRSQPANESSG